MVKVKNLHINVVLLILGIFSLHSAEFDSFSNPSFFKETEIEESIDDTRELDFDSELSSSDSDNGGNAAILNIDHRKKNLSFGEVASQYSESKDLSQRPHLFILYCCLKLDC